MLRSQKEWIATLDNRTRHSHRELDGKVVGWNEKFETILGSKMEAPGDKNGVAGDIYNCRCTLGYVEKSGIVVDEEFEKTTEDGQQISELNYEDWKRWKENIDSQKVKEYNKTGLNNVKINFKQTKYAFAKEKTENAIETAYEYHRKKNNLQSVSFAELKNHSFEDFVDFKNLSDEVCEVFSTSMENLVKKYDTAIYRIRTMTKEESIFRKDSFAYVVHNYENDTAEMVINPVKFKNIKESIKKTVDKNYCANIYEKNYEKYVVTHEFAHSIIDTRTPLKNSRNWVNADYTKIRKARNEIETLYNKYINELDSLEKKKKDAEMRFILSFEDTTKEFAEIIAEIQRKK